MNMRKLIWCTTLVFAVLLIVKGEEEMPRKQKRKSTNITTAAVRSDGTGNLSKQRREELIGKINEIRAFLENSGDTNATRLIAFAAELEKEVRQKKYGLVFEQHKEHVDVILEKNLPVLTEVKSRFINNGGDVNFLIEGDNLAALKLLEKTHRGRIDVIYIDPPYNTGKEDFIYNDAIVDVKDLFRHSKWLSFMEKRLLLLKSLLRKEGYICISIDDHEMAALKLMCDAIFGPDSFIANIPRRTKASGKTTANIAQNHDYVLIYSSGQGAAAIGGIPHDDKGFKFSDEYEDERGKYKLNQTLDYDSLQYSASLDYELRIGDEVFYPGSDKKLWKARQSGKHKRADWAWRWSKAKFEFGLNNGFVVVKRKKDGTARIYTKTYLNATIEDTDDDGYQVVITERDKKLSTLDFMEKEYSNDNAKKDLKQIFGKSPVEFDYSKPVNLIEMLLRISRANHGIVLDCFAGSGTTGQAVLRLNALGEDSCRKFILVTNNENGICEKVTYERLKRVITKEKYKARLKYFKIEYVPIERQVYFDYADDLLKHIRELVELENAIDFNKDETIAITVTDDEFEKFVTSEKKMSGKKAVYVGHDVLIGAKAKQTLERNGIEVKIIPEYYYADQEG